MEYIKIHNNLDFPMILYHHPLRTINDMEQNKKSQVNENTFRNVRILKQYSKKHSMIF